jgi:phage tail-like protein
VTAALARLAPSRLLLDGRAGWHAAALDGVVAGERLELRPPGGVRRPLVEPTGSFGGLVAPKGVAADRAGVIHRLDTPAAVVLRLDPCTPAPEPLPCLGGPGSAPRRLRNPEGMAISRSGTLYVADTGNRRVVAYTLPGLGLRAIWRKPGWEPRDVAVGRCGEVYVADAAHGLVHVFDAAGWRARWDGGGALHAPVRLAVDGAGRIYVIDEDASDVVVLETDGRVAGRVAWTDEIAGRFPGGAAVRPAGFEPEGRYHSEPLDSRIHRCTWHRVALVASLPRGTRIEVHTHTTEAPLTADELRALPDDRWDGGHVRAGAGEGAWDCLVLSPPGRYLCVRLTLAGDGTATPALDAVAIEFPRSSSLRFLPAVFREEPSSARFLDRFVSIFDAERGELERRIDGGAALYDPRATPAAARWPQTDFLSWLGSWLALTLDRTWSEEKRRRLVRRAGALYAIRGTPRGLREHIALYTGTEPRIVEHFRLRSWLFLASGRLGDAATLYGKAIEARLQLGENSGIGSFELLDVGDPVRDPFERFAHRFTVFVPLRDGSPAARRAVERIVALAKPAHSAVAVQALEPGFRVGTHALVGLDTVVARWPDRLVEGQARIGRDAVLGPSPCEGACPVGRVGVRARIGSTAVIE